MGRGKRRSVVRERFPICSLLFLGIGSGILFWDPMSNDSHSFPPISLFYSDPEINFEWKRAKFGERRYVFKSIYFGLLPM